MIGQTISHYRILEKIGAGGMGVVYKAQDLKLERTVALKFLPADLALHPRDKETLIREARAASALDNANIGAIYGLEEGSDHCPFIIMAYYEGQTLAQILSSGRSLWTRAAPTLCRVSRTVMSPRERSRKRKQPTKKRPR
jgi:serine/threonine protein kinase